MLLLNLFYLSCVIALVVDDVAPVKGDEAGGFMMPEGVTVNVGTRESRRSGGLLGSTTTAPVAPPRPRAVTTSDVVHARLCTIDVIYTR
jgi:hypothetical protein